MGQGSSTDKSASQQTSVGDCLLRYSAQASSHNPDRITLQGIQTYITSNEALGNGHYVARSDKAGSYTMISDLTKQSGMSEERRYEVCFTAHRNLNRYGQELTHAGIAEPEKPGQTKPIATSSAQTGTSNIPPDTRADLQELLNNPRSFLALSGKPIASYENCDPGKLKEAIHADQAFLIKGAPHWTLDNNSTTRNALATSWSDHLNSPQARNAGSVGATNATPFDAIRGADTELSNAIKGGYDIRTPEAQKAFSEVALGVNLAIHSSNTLAGRGADTLTEQTMLYSPDGHSNKGPTGRNF